MTTKDVFKYCEKIDDNGQDGDVEIAEQIRIELLERFVVHVAEGKIISPTVVARLIKQKLHLPVDKKYWIDL